MFETERLLLREVTRADIPAWQEYLRDEETRAGLFKDSFLIQPRIPFSPSGKKAVGMGDLS
jgi:RimJ/RimL family protein N-acetyltransferase